MSAMVPRHDIVVVREDDAEILGNRPPMDLADRPADDVILLPW
jgi:hypothetical protein